MWYYSSTRTKIIYNNGFFLRATIFMFGVHSFSHCSHKFQVDLIRTYKNKFNLAFRAKANTPNLDRI